MNTTFWLDYFLLIQYELSIRGSEGVNYYDLGGSSS